MSTKKKKKIYAIHITQTCEQDYLIEASSKKEAIRLAEEGYEYGDYDPSNTDGDLYHDIKVARADL